MLCDVVRLTKESEVDDAQEEKEEGCAMLPALIVRLFKVPPS